MRGELGGFWGFLALGLRVQGLGLRFWVEGFGVEDLAEVLGFEVELLASTTLASLAALACGERGAPKSPQTLNP